jgi:hypothetical protein
MSTWPGWGTGPCLYRIRRYHTPEHTLDKCERVEVKRTSNHLRPQRLWSLIPTEVHKCRLADRGRDERCIAGMRMLDRVRREKGCIRSEPEDAGPECGPHSQDPKGSRASGTGSSCRSAHCFNRSHGDRFHVFCIDRRPCQRDGAYDLTVRRWPVRPDHFGSRWNSSDRLSYATRRPVVYQYRRIRHRPDEYIGGPWSPPAPTDGRAYRANDWGGLGGW